MISAYEVLRCEHISVRCRHPSNMPHRLAEMPYGRIERCVYGESKVPLFFPLFHYFFHYHTVFPLFRSYAELGRRKCYFVLLQILLT